MARRSMTNALELTPEKRAFIAKDVRDEPRPVRSEPQELKREKPIELTEPQPQEPAPAHHSSVKPKPLQSKEPAPAYGGGLVQLSVRLKPDLVRSIRRVLFEAKLNGQETLTQQDIVEEALSEWLASRGQTG